MTKPLIQAVFRAIKIQNVTQSPSISFSQREISHKLCGKPPRAPTSKPVSWQVARRLTDQRHGNQKQGSPNKPSQKKQNLAVGNMKR